jgi:hypothetical protein
VRKLVLVPIFYPGVCHFHDEFGFNPQILTKLGCNTLTFGVLKKSNTGAESLVRTNLDDKTSLVTSLFFFLLWFPVCYFHPDL